MEFRWAALIALWTMLVAPVFNAPFATPPGAARSASVAAFSADSSSLSVNTLLKK